MDKIINRRRLVAGAAALPIFALVPGEAISAAPFIETPETPEMDRAAKPDISEIPGLDQFASLHCIMIVTTPDGRTGIGNLKFHGFGHVQAVINTGDGWQSAVVPVDGIESLPTWMQHEIGYAALTASYDRLPR